VEMMAGKKKKKKKKLMKYMLPTFLLKGALSAKIVNFCYP
jgi:hypothetical protein